MKREFQIELDSKTIKGLNKVISDDLTEVSFMLIEGAILTRVENYLAIIQLKKLMRKHKKKDLKVLLLFFCLESISSTYIVHVTSVSNLLICHKYSV